MILTNTTTPLCHRFGVKRAVEMNCEAGFRSIDYCFCDTKSPLLEKDNAALLRELKATMAHYGATAHQAHAPFPIGPEAYRVPADNVHELLLRTLDACAELGVKYVVFHPIRIYDSTMEERIAKNVEVMTPYGEYAKKCGVQIAVENLFCQHKENKKKLTANACSTGLELAATVDALGDPFVACIDVGHSGLAGQSAAEMIRTLGKKRLHALHIHDNDYFDDLHTLPTLGDMDWDSITSALADIDYDDSFTFEIVGRYLTKCPEELCVDALRYLNAMGNYFVRQIEAKKKALTAK